MSDRNPLNENRTRLIELLIHQQTKFHNWIKFVITVQAGLWTAWWLSKDNAPLVLKCALPIFGILCAIVFQMIISREQKWSIWFQRRYNIINKASDKILPEKPNEIDAMPVGIMSKRISWISMALAVTWFLVALPSLHDLCKILSVP